MTDEFGARWGWVAAVDSVSEATRVSWEQVWKMGVLEFFNTLAYLRDKAEHERQNIEKWKRKN